MDLSRYGAQCSIPTCDLHQEDELDIYCHTCKKSICLECTKKDHANHEYEKHSKIARTFRQEISIINEKTEIILSKHRQSLEILSHFKGLTRNKVDHTINRMNSHRATIHALVDSITDEMIQICKEKGNGREQERDSCITTHRKTIQEIEEIFTFMQESSSSLSENSLVQLKIDFEYKLDQASEIDRVSSRDEDDLFYVEGRIIKDNLKAIVGSFIPNDPTKVEVNEITSFTVGDMNILTVVPVSPESAWIHRKKSTKVELVDINGSVKDTRERGHRYNSFDIDGDGDIYYSSADKIQKVDKNGTKTTVMKTYLLKPKGVSLTKEGDLLVTLTEKWDYEPKDDSRRILQRIKTSGEVVTTYEFDTDGSTRLFTFPRRVRQNYNGDICVVDYTGKYTGRLCVLGIDGVMKFIYNGQNLKQKFLPEDVVFDCTSNIIINDVNNHSIHLLRPTGEFVKYLTEDVTEFTIALGLYQSALWVGCDKGVIKVFKYRCN